MFTLFARCSKTSSPLSLLHPLLVYNDCPVYKYEPTTASQDSNQTFLCPSQSCTSMNYRHVNINVLFLHLFMEYSIPRRNRCSYEIKYHRTQSFLFRFYGCLLKHELFPVPIVAVAIQVTYPVLSFYTFLFHTHISFPLNI